MPEQQRSSGEQQVRHRHVHRHLHWHLQRHMRRRAIGDMAIVALLVSVVSALAGDRQTALMLGVATLSFGILFYVMRRGHDAVTLARADRWREDAVAGRGISLAEWHRGGTLPGWDLRRDG